MRLGRPKLKAIAAWLGIFALSINALLPIHLAFDLADAVAGAGGRLAQASPHHQHDGRHLLATLAGHRDGGGKSGGPVDRHHLDCFVCGSLGALAGFAATAGIALPTPALLDAPALLTAAAVELRGAAPAAYRSRAPPVG